MRENTEKMYELAFQYKSTKLWQQLYDDELFAVQLEDGEIGYCSIMGELGDHIALILAGVGFYFYKTQETENEQRAYQNAMMSDQPAVVQNYLDMYTQAPKAHRDSVNAHLVALQQIDLDWTNALMSGSKVELEKYMRRHPNSVHNVEAKLQIDSLDWVVASQTDTPEAYQAYIDAHYDGVHYDEARQNFDRLDAQQV